MKPSLYEFLRAALPLGPPSSMVKPFHMPLLDAVSDDKFHVDLLRLSYRPSLRWNPAMALIVHESYSVIDHAPVAAPRKPRRRSKGWRKHTRRTKALARRNELRAAKPAPLENL